MEVQTTYQYVSDLKETLSDMVKRAEIAVQGSAKRYKHYHDRKSKMRVLNEGDEVLVLLPTDHNKLLLKWQGPFSVVKRTRECDYVVKLSSGSEKVLHINMLKKYTRRTDTDGDIVSVGFLIGNSILPDEDVYSVEVQLLPTGKRKL